MVGGRYKPLTDREVERIHAASLDLLEQVGLADPTDAWRNRVVGAGGWVNEAGRLCFPRSLVEDCVAVAGRSFSVLGRDPDHDLDVSGARVHFGGGSATIQILDAHTNRFRETKLVDLYDISRLEDALDSMHFVMRACIARDMKEAELLDVNTAYAIMSATSKHFATSFFEPEHLEMAVAMFDLSLGGDGTGARWRARPFAEAIVTFAVPPLRLAKNACRVLDAAARNDMPAILCSAGQAGATAPAALAGALTQGNAEVLAALTAINLLKPGHPLFMGNWPFVSDLRSGAFAGGSGEMALLAAASAQMARFYDVPSSIGSGMSSSKQPDLQAGWEKGYLTALPALAGGNMISQTTGILADIIACSQEAFILDSDMVSGVQRAVRGIEVNDESLSVDDIKEVVSGPGHFLGQASTLRLMRSEYVYPKLADRQNIEAWEENGGVDIRTRGLAALTQIMKEHYPQYVEPAHDARIRERFDIRLRPEDLKPGNGRW
jgi:trimethylamine--corrinoid protein Co-methyltransferase